MKMTSPTFNVLKFLSTTTTRGNFNAFFINSHREDGCSQVARTIPAGANTPVGRSKQKRWMEWLRGANLQPLVGPKRWSSAHPMLLAHGHLLLLGFRCRTQRMQRLHGSLSQTHFISLFSSFLLVIT